MIVRPERRKLGVVRAIASTGKELPFSASTREEAWWKLAGMIEDKFGEEGATPEDIYQQILAPMGMTADTTFELLTAAKRGGYLR